ncbi:M48 family metallopeptidase [Desulforegula conservatrix]|uniref:M48 family metallopeptidase n=1 Tax=Desulforegula conservatrix TaxID=153026 RepID=UPI0003FA4C43|nr:M48 family metallopeptidase [Desulforegula conservatrix]
MFSNFIYFIAAILLFGAYEQNAIPGENSTTWLLYPSFGILFFFFLIEFFFFRNLCKRVDHENIEKSDHDFTRASGFFSIAVLIIYGAFIYLLNISEYVPDFSKHPDIQTFKNLVVLSFFIILISAHWSASYQAYKRIYSENEGVLAYIKSQLMFSVPVIFPWLILSIFSDIINVLPLPDLRKWLASTEGELFFFVFLIIVMSFAAPFLIMTAWKCRPLKADRSHEIIEGICRKTGIKFRKILEWPLKGGNAITAGVMGVFTRFRYLLITPGLIRSMTDDELGAVVAHEIGHVKYRHMILYMVVIGAFSFTSIILAPSLEEILAFSGILTTSLEPHAMATRYISFIPGIISVIFFIAFIRFVFGFFMRNFERQADSFAARIMGSPMPLVRAFYRIVLLSRQNPEKPSWHHFSIKQRIDFVLKCEGSPNVIKAQDKKVFMSLAAYFSILLIVIMSTGIYEKSDFRDTLFRKFLTDVSKGELKQHEMDQIMADSYYMKGNIEKSAFFYEQADQKNPDNPEVLNSLAWIYATSEKPSLRNPVKAVELAKKAVLLKPESPHIWDTLAESCFASEDYSNAINYGKKAISLAEEKDLDYYKEQLEKYGKKAGMGQSAWK